MSVLRAFLGSAARGISLYETTPTISPASHSRRQRSSPRPSPPKPGVDWTSNGYSCLPTLLSWSAEPNFPFFSPRSGLRIWSRETGPTVPSRVSSPILHIRAESDAYSRVTLLSSVFRGGVHLLYRHTIGSFPSFWGQAVAYRWHSPPRVHRHRGSSSQGNSSNRCCLFNKSHGPISARPSFSIPTVNTGTVDRCDTASIVKLLTIMVGCACVSFRGRGHA